jgi:hypothetical protein
MKLLSMTDFVREGREAFARGKQSCPYEPGTRASVWWRTGWSLAKAEAKTGLDVIEDTLGDLLND